MLLELRQSELARRLTVASAAIVDLLGVVAAADSAGYERVVAAWPLGPAPKQPLVEAVLALPLADREALREAVAADLGFEASLDDAGFSFSFPALDDSVRLPAKRLLVSLYDEIFTKGGFELGSGGVANRTRWEQAFRDANPEVTICPACLIAELEQRVEGRSAVDADHYLPKALYPPLAVHGLNLVPTCKTCNQVAKGSDDPLATAEAEGGLPGIWFPYRRPGIEEAVLSFRPAAADKAVVTLEGRQGAEGRARLFDRLFKVSERWSGTLGSVHREIVADLRGSAVPAEAAAVKARLAQFAATKEAILTSTPRAFLAARYCHWLAADGRAIATLTGTLKNADIFDSQI